MKNIVIIVLGVCFSFQSHALTSWGSQLGVRAKDSRIFPAHHENAGPHFTICYELTPTMEAEAVCRGIPKEQWNPTRHGVCITYSVSSSSYLACMYNKKLQDIEVPKCYTDSVSEPELLACFMSRPDLKTSDEEKLFEEFNKMFPDVKIDVPEYEPETEEQGDTHQMDI